MNLLTADCGLFLQSLNVGLCIMISGILGPPTPFSDEKVGLVLLGGQGW